ncbi:chitin synthase chs-2 isoform X2 [Magallana gigas]|uniref:chitin synthase chs-2 isoform X2 n=1 Tax=Magallana gigas TaxID=29159 RepID=UPI00333F4302
MDEKMSKPNSDAAPMATEDSDVPTTDYDSDIEIEESLKTQQKKQNPKPKYWDRFGLKGNDEERQDVHTYSSFQLIKLGLYAVLFLLFLASLVTQKLSLAIASSKLTTDFKQDKKTASNSSDHRHVSDPAVHGLLLFTAMCVPYVLTFSSSCWKVYFGNLKRPSISSVIVCAVLAALQSIGLCLLVFHLLPNVGPIQGLLVLGATGIIPSFLKLHLTLNKTCEIRAKITEFAVDLLSLSLQLSITALIFVPNVTFFCRVSSPPGSNGGYYVTKCLTNTVSRIKAILALLLTSLTWWENFLEKLIEKKSLKGRISNIQSDLNENRAFINIFVSMCKFVTSFITVFIIEDSSQIFEQHIWQEFANQKVQDILDIILLILSSIAAYFIACTSCKLQMQIFSFSIPCLLSTPIAAILFALICSRSGEILKDSFYFDCDISCDAQYLKSNYCLVVALLWTLSLYWTAKHIWFPEQERIAKVERLFVNPLYCGILLEQDLVLNRKRCYNEKMDKDQSFRKPEEENDYYRFEVHILFDDAFKNGILNEYVTMFAKVIDEATSSLNSEPIKMMDPFLFCTCYGGQIVYKMPGGNFMFIHLKDKTKIRRKKRWSQVMYMYYLLGHRLQVEKESFAQDKPAKIDDLFKSKAENTFILALDGDVDFTPGAVRILIDRMKKNKDVGAACGRIHPIGNGPIVWYQKFEYAIAHWLQKATEHVLGCVLCSPGCFSLFRGSALMDYNVMKKYVQVPSDASEVLMYDLGEDRWLCTLLLQQGYRVDYAAGADAYTYAPEGFDEFFNQRKRWGPSTLANILALLQEGDKIVDVNPNISWLYIIYLGSLMVSTIIGPATILMLIAGALVTVFDVSIVNGYIASVIPGVLFFVICLVCSTKVQLIVAQVLSGFYVIIMMVVMVGLLITALTQSPYHPSVIFLLGLVIIFVVAAVLHPREWVNILYGFLYFVSIPSGFLVQVIYSLCNLNDVSWGTRESSTPKLEDKKESDPLSKIFSPFTKLTNFSPTKDDSEKEKLYKLLEKAVDNRCAKCQIGGGSIKQNVVTNDEADQPCPDKNPQIDNSKSKANGVKNNGSSWKWIENNPFRGEAVKMDKKESKFWRQLVKQYLDPNDESMKNDLTEKLRELRNNVCSGMALLNILWIVVNFMFQFRSPTVVTFQLPIKDYGDENGIYEMKIEMLGLLFIIFFLVLLLIQFCGMIMHRWGTFIHLVAITELPNPFRRKNNAADFVGMINKHGNDEHEMTNAETLKQIESLQRFGTRFARAPHNNDIVAGTDNPDQDYNQANSRPRLRK